MLNKQRTYQVRDIEFRIIYSRRRSLGISILPDSSVIVRAPYLASVKSISRLVLQKAAWIINHRDSYRENENKKLTRLYVPGEVHLFRGIESVLKIEKSKRPYIRFSENTMELGLNQEDDPKAVRNLLYKGYKTEALKVFSGIFSMVLEKNETQAFKPAGLVVRSMKNRWGSCSKNGIITLSTELIKMADIYIEYVIIHELCHLKHRNHKKEFYNLFSELFPGYKQVRKELRNYVR